MKTSDDHNHRLFPAAPRIGVGVVVIHNDRFVLVERQNHPRRGEWSIPGGLVQLGETVKEAAQREIREECNLVIDNLEFVDVFEYIENHDDGIKYHFVVLDYVATWKDGKLLPGSDAPNAKWFNLNDLENIQIRSQLKNIIKKAMLVKK